VISAWLICPVPADDEQLNTADVAAPARPAISIETVSSAEFTPVPVNELDESRPTPLTRSWQEMFSPMLLRRASNVVLIR
jgi:hypothetical protein